MTHPATKARKAGKFETNEVGFDRDGRPSVARPFLVVSKSGNGRVRWKAQPGLRVVSIVFTGERGCPLTGLDWSDPAAVVSTGISPAAEVDMSYSYDVDFVDADGRRHHVDPRMIVGP